jgi:hypothetical protein
MKLAGLCKWLTVYGFGAIALILAITGLRVVPVGLMALAGGVFGLSPSAFAFGIMMIAVPQTPAALTICTVVLFARYPRAYPLGAALSLIFWIPVGLKLSREGLPTVLAIAAEVVFPLVDVVVWLLRPAALVNG